MKFGRGWVIGIGALLLAGTAQAGLIVKSIDIAMVNTDFDSRAIPGLVPDELAFAFSLSNFMSAWNDSDKRVCAKELQDFVKNTIAPYKYPRRVVFIDRLPRNESGKIQRFRLRDQP